MYGRGSKLWRNEAASSEEDVAHKAAADADHWIGVVRLRLHKDPLVHRDSEKIFADFCVIFCTEKWSE